MIPAWRLLRVSGNQPQTLFHGWRGSRKLPLDKELPAVRSWRWNPGKKKGPGFFCGWHVAKSRDEIETYRQQRFKRPEELVVCRVWVNEMEPKPRASSGICLADKMLIRGDDWSQAMLKRTHVKQEAL